MAASRDDTRWAKLARELHGTPSVTCPRCGRTSHHPDDVAEGYCGACHDWTSPRTNLSRMIWPQLAAQVRRVCAELS
jgi:ribosomal protein L37E